MTIAKHIREALEKSSWIRAMFDEGQRLAREVGKENVFDFSLGNPDVEPPPAFHDALVRLARDDAKGSHQYMPNAGYAEARTAVAKQVAVDHGVSLDAANVIMTVGAAGGLNVVFKTILNPGDEVITIRPYFVEYGFYVTNHGGRLVTVAARPDFALDVEAVRAALTDKTAAVLINSPNNPTGRIYSRESLEALATVLTAHGAATGRTPYLIADEPYRAIAYGGREVSPVLCLYPNAIVVSSYSKTLSLSGERIGYIAVNPACDAADLLMKGFTFANRILGFVNAPALMQRIVVELAGGSVDISEYERRRDACVAGLRQAGIEFAPPEGAFYLFCKAPTDDDVAFAMFLKDYHVLVVPGSGFGAPGWFRLCYCVSRATIDNGLAKLGEAMAEWRRRHP